MLGNVVQNVTSSQREGGKWLLQTLVRSQRSVYLQPAGGEQKHPLNHPSFTFQLSSFLQTDFTATFQNLSILTPLHDISQTTSALLCPFFSETTFHPHLPHLRVWVCVCVNAALTHIEGVRPCFGDDHSEWELSECLS